MSEAYWERYESLVEKKIREAQERGAFDDLPGTGKPLKGLHGPDDELWWVRGFVAREGLPTDALLPTPLRLRKEIERLPETVRDLPSEQAVREVVAELNARIVAWLRAPTGPQITIRAPRADDVVDRWRTDHATGRAARPSPPPVADVPEVAASDPERTRRRLGFRRRRRRG